VPGHDRVLSSQAELGVPRGPARALVRASTATVGVLVHDVGDPYFTAIGLGAVAAADEDEHLVTVCNTFGDLERERRYVAELRAQGAAAIVLTGNGSADPAHDAVLRAELASFHAGGGRVATVGRRALGADAVLPDDRGGAELLGRALLELGHRRIGIITGPPSHAATLDRLNGLADGGVPLAGDRIVAGGFGREGGVRGAGALLDRHVDLTAIVAPDDQAALGALSVLRSCGLQVPGDVSLFGFGDIPAARDVTPALSTVRLPLHELGATAMHLALDDWRGAPRTIVLPTELVLRDSARSIATS
jgi:LacI family transcriptional regulator